MTPAKRLLLVIWAFVIAAVAWEIPEIWPRHFRWALLFPISPAFVLLFVAVFIVVAFIAASKKAVLPEGQLRIWKRQRIIAWTFVILAAILMGFIGDHHYLSPHGRFDCLEFYGLEVLSIYDIDKTGGESSWGWRLVDQLIMLKYLLSIMTAAICTHLIIAEEKKGTKTPCGTTDGPSADGPDASIT